MKKIILFTLTTLLLLNCSNTNNESSEPSSEPPIPCMDGVCLTDEQLQFFSDKTIITNKKELYEATELYLSSNNIDNIPAGIFSNLHNLTDLYLYSNNISSLPTGLFNNLINLTILYLYNNDICIVDKSNVGLTEDVALIFDGWNCLTDEQLNFFSGHISILDTKQKLFEATSLNLRGKGLSTLPTGIFNNLTNVTNLRLDLNQLASVPTDIGNLTSLTELYLHNNQLINIPAEIGNLTNLTDLNLAFNDLTSIPDGIFTKLTNLTELYLYENDLTSIPKEIGNLTNLTTLWLVNNNLTSIPDGIFTKLTNLTSLLLKNGSSDPNMFDCNDTNYSTWGLDPMSLPTIFVCNN